MRPIIGIPVGLSIVGFVLAMLSLFAGKQQGFMEDYFILMVNPVPSTLPTLPPGPPFLASMLLTRGLLQVNTSDLGQNIVPTPSGGASVTATPTSGSSSGLAGLGDIFSQVEASVTAAIGSAETAVASWEKGLADQLANDLGIKEFYSLYVMDICQGDFTPNATAPNAGYNVTNCTAPLKTGAYSQSCDTVCN